MVVVVISLIAVRNGRPSKATNATTATTTNLRIPTDTTESSTTRSGRARRVSVQSENMAVGTELQVPEPVGSGVRHNEFMSGSR